MVHINLGCWVGSGRYPIPDTYNDLPARVESSLHPSHEAYRTIHPTQTTAHHPIPINEFGAGCAIAWLGYIRGRYYEALNSKEGSMSERQFLLGRAPLLCKDQPNILA